MGRKRLSLLWAVILLSAKALVASAVGDTANETSSEDDYFEEPLEKWLENFRTYTFMLEQDVEDKAAGEEGDEAVAGTEEPFTPEDDLDLGEEDYDQGSAAPITISMKKFGSLLDPNVDYKLKLESLVAEEGSVFVILETFENKTDCGVGGFSLHSVEEESNGLEELEQSEDAAGSPRRRGGRPVIGTTTRTPLVAFAVDTEAETPTTWTVGHDTGSEWIEHSKDLSWAMGQLAGGGLLTLIFTPPECGCLILKAYYALPVGDNVTLVVGPDSYSSDLEKLLCVDPTVRNIEENLIDTETEDAVATDERIPSEESGDGPPGVSRKGPKGRGKVNRRKAKLQKKKRRQEARKIIRQAGRRVTRQRVKAHLRLRRKLEKSEVDEEGRPVRPSGGKWARKEAKRQARKQSRKARRDWKGKKPWKKHRKHARRNRNKHNRLNRHHNRTRNATEELEEEAYEEFLNATTESPTEDDTLADLLLGDEMEEDQPEGGSDAEGADEDVPHHRRGRKHRRQKQRKAKKMKNKEKRKGAKFCCKHGIKHKKWQLNSNSTEERDIRCDTVNDIFMTYALHQFGVDNAHCSSRYETCCSKFTSELWENMKAKKAARKAKRKQQRKATRQQRRQNRRNRSSTTPATSSDPDFIE
ncbi:uncharacterized protein [Palaemon carinicauda]|uniref:uncharacterized protein n=1 Tax=Palaemon carinicauda TaxID=392227 RepID=UPI0035B670B7